MHGVLFFFSEFSDGPINQPGERNRRNNNQQQLNRVLGVGNVVAGAQRIIVAVAGMCPHQNWCENSA